MILLESNADKIATEVRQMRQRRGWSQEELATHTGLSRPTIARIERGDDVSTATLRKVAEAFELTLGLVEP